jgi:hypothetical protein
MRIYPENFKYVTLIVSEKYQREVSTPGQKWKASKHPIHYELPIQMYYKFDFETSISRKLYSFCEVSCLFYDLKYISNCFLKKKTFHQIYPDPCSSTLNIMIWLWKCYKTAITVICWVPIMLL